MKSRIHNGVGDVWSASKAYSLSSIVATYSTFLSDTVDGYATDIQRLRVDRPVDGIRVQLPEDRGVDIAGGQDRLCQVRARALRVVTIRKDVDLRVDGEGSDMTAAQRHPALNHEKARRRDVRSECERPF